MPQVKTGKQAKRRRPLNAIQSGIFALPITTRLLNTGAVVSVRQAETPVLPCCIAQHTSVPPPVPARNPPMRQGPSDRDRELSGPELSESVPSCEEPPRCKTHDR